MIITSNINLDNIIKDNLVIQDNSHVKISGIINGNITINSNCSLILSGIQNGDIFASNESDITISGIVNGNLNGKGYFTLKGILNTDNVSPVNLKIEKDAIINGKKYW